MKLLSASARSLFLLLALLLFLALFVDAKCVPRNATHDISPSTDAVNESKEISKGEEQKKSSKSDEKSDNDDNKKKEHKDDDDDDAQKKEKKSKHDDGENEKKDEKDEDHDDKDDDKKDKEKSDDKDEKKDEKAEDHDDNDDDDDDDDDDDKKDKKKSDDKKDKEKSEDEEKESSSSSKDPVLTQKVCGSTRFPKDCLSSIAPFFTGNTDPVSVLKMEVQAVRKGFTTAIAKVKQMKKESEGKWNKSALDTCVENFSSGLTDLDSALEAITNHDITSLQTMLSSVLTYVTTCEDAMAEDPDSDELPNITNMEQKLTNLASNSLDIAEQLNWT